MKKLIKFSVILVIITVAIVGCRKETPMNGGYDDPDYPPGNKACPPVKGLTTTDAGKVAETVFIQYYKKMTQEEQDFMEGYVGDFRKKSEAAISEEESNDLATMVALLTGEGYTPNLLGTIAATAVLKYENNPYALYNFGGFLRITGNNEQALTVLKQAAKLAPSSAPILSALGSALFDEGDISGAEFQFNKALNKDPDCAFAHEGRFAVKYRKSLNSKDDLIPLFGKDDDLVPAFRSFKPNISKDAKKKIDKAAKKASEDMVKELTNKLKPKFDNGDDDLVPDFVKENLKKPQPVDQLIQEVDHHHIIGRPRAPYYRGGLQEQYVGSRDHIDSELERFHTDVYASSMSAFFVYQAHSWIRPKSTKKKKVWGIENIEALIELMITYFTACCTVMEFYDINESLRKKGFFDKNTYAETEADFKRALMINNFKLQYMDDLLDEFYLITQHYMYECRYKVDYQHFDFLRMTYAAPALVQCAGQIPYFRERENQANLTLDGPFFVRDYVLPKMIPYNECVEETRVWYHVFSKYNLSTVSEVTFGCDAVTKNYRFYIDGNETPMPPFSDNISESRFRRHFNVLDNNRGSDKNDDKVLYISYDKDYGEASIGKKVPVIVPGSKYENMVGLYCGVEIK